MKIIKFLIMLALIYWAGTWAYEKYYINAEKSPFWKGTDTVQVCKKPYYSSKGCYKLEVSLSDDKKTATIHFENGGYVTTNIYGCWFAAKMSNEPRSVFCRSEDRDGNQWDFMPAWVNY